MIELKEQGNQTEITETGLSKVCGNCSYFIPGTGAVGLCRLKAEADFEDAAYVKPERKACSFVQLHPF